MGKPASPVARGADVVGQAQSRRRCGPAPVEGRLAETKLEDGATHLRLRGPSCLCAKAHACAHTTATHARTHTAVRARACVRVHVRVTRWSGTLAGHVDGARDTSAPSVGARHALRVRRSPQHGCQPSRQRKCSMRQSRRFHSRTTRHATTHPARLCAHWSGGLSHWSGGLSPSRCRAATRPTASD